MGMCIILTVFFLHRIRPLKFRLILYRIDIRMCGEIGGLVGGLKSLPISYDFIWSGYIHSQQNNDIFCNNVKAKNIVITIENEDNTAVNFKKINVYGLPFSIVFNAKNLNDYFLFYGNPGLLQPNYDLQYFKAQIPNHLNTLTLQKEELLQKIVPENKSDYNLFLYLILAIIVIVLLFFSFKMLKESKN